MFKFKKIFLYITTISFLILTFLELIVYLLHKNNLFGLIYLIISSMMIFLIIPTLFNYEDKYSKARISKIIIFIIIGIFCSFVLKNIIVNNMNYIDSSISFNERIFLFKNILKPIVYLLYSIFIVLETELCNKIKKIINKNLIK